MSAYDEGYAKGYEDGLSGEPNDVTGACSWISGIAGAIVDLVTDTDEDQSAWEEEFESGYMAGYEDGKEEREANQENENNDHQILPDLDF